jgi:hypothetical protein
MEGDCGWKVRSIAWLFSLFCFIQRQAMTRCRLHISSYRTRTVNSASSNHSVITSTSTTSSVDATDCNPNLLDILLETMLQDISSSYFLSSLIQEATTPVLYMALHSIVIMQVVSFTEVMLVLSSCYGRRFMVRFLCREGFISWKRWI